MTSSSQLMGLQFQTPDAALPVNLNVTVTVTDGGSVTLNVTVTSVDGASASVSRWFLVPITVLPAPDTLTLTLQNASGNEHQRRLGHGRVGEHQLRDPTRRTSSEDSKKAASARPSHPPPPPNSLPCFPLSFFVSLVCCV
jgi:hypothetical protein